jgi:2-furoate---CoA ligase
MFDLGRSFVASVERSPNALAVVDRDRRLNYAEWYAEVCRVIDGLAALGLRKGDHLAVVLQNRLAMASLHWACQIAGIVIVPSTGGLKPKSSIIA